MPQQAMSNWCWAAIGAAVAGYYDRRQRAQHAVASAVLGYDCAAFDADAELGLRCNVAAGLDDVLERLGCFSHWSPGKPTLARLEAEMDAGRPVALCIDWRGGGSHYAVVAGCCADAREVYVADPLHGPSVQAFASFPLGYRTGGYWRGTYWTREPRSGAGARAGCVAQPGREVRT